MGCNVFACNSRLNFDMVIRIGCTNMLDVFLHGRSLSEFLTLSIKELQKLDEKEQVFCSRFTEATGRHFFITNLALTRERLHYSAPYKNLCLLFKILKAKHKDGKKSCQAEYIYIVLPEPMRPCYKNLMLRF